MRGVGLLEPVQTVKRGGLIALRERRIIKNGIHEICHFAFEQKHRLPDVEQLRGVFIEDMHAQQFQGLPVKQ